jgi:hypothetical protein
MFRVLSMAVNLATEHLNVSSAYTLIKFLRKNCPTQLPILHETLLVRAAKFGNLTLLKILIAELEVQNTEHVAEIQTAVDSVFSVLRSTLNCRPNFTFDQVAVLRYFLDNKIITAEDTAPYHYTMLRAVDLAAQLGDNLLVDILVEYGATPLHLQVALTHILAPPSRRSQLPFHTGELFSLPCVPVFHMTQHLLKTGTIVTATALSWCENRASIVMRMHYDKARSAGNLADDPKTTVLVGYQVMKQGLLLRGTFGGIMKLVLRLITNGEITIPTEPLLFQSMAGEITEWLKASTENSS